MYEPPQKKNSSWTPSTVQKKGKSPGQLGHFSIQPKPNQSSESSQEIGEYSRTSMDRLAANVMRSLQTREQEIAEESIQPKFESPWAPTFDPPPPLPESPASQLKGAFAPVSKNPIQRQCAECAKEENEQKGEERKDLEETGIQTKLTVGAPGDTYEQEADRVASQVMSMSAPPDSSASVQRQLDTNHPHHPHQIWQRAQSIKPVVQRQIDPRVQMRQMIQRAHQMEGNQASGDLESHLNASKGGGSPLSENVRGFMEPRFGADFSGVRVHTGSEAVQMNRELGAQAFTHGSDVYFGEGKSPGNNELMAHELTHVVQQAGSSSNVQRLPIVINSVNSRIQKDEQSEVERVSKLKENYKNAVENRDWKNIALYLNAFNRQDILTRLEAFSREEIGKIHRGALDHPRVGSGSQVAKLTRAAYLDEKYEGFIKSGDWGKAAVVLNGFNETDISSRLRVLRLRESGKTDLENLKKGAIQAMPGWSQRVVGLINQILYSKSFQHTFMRKDEHGEKLEHKVEAHFFEGKSNKRALVFGGIHGSEQAGIQVVEMLLKKLNDNEDKPYYTVIVIPVLFERNANRANEHRFNRSWLHNENNKKNTRRTPIKECPPDLVMTSGKCADPNRNAPKLGEDINLKDAKDHLGRTMLTPNIILGDLIKRFNPERVASVHSITNPNSAGFFADPHTDTNGQYGNDEKNKTKDDWNLAIDMAKKAKEKGAKVKENKIIEVKDKTTGKITYDTSNASAAYGGGEFWKTGSDFNKPSGTEHGASWGDYISQATPSRESKTIITIETPKYHSAEENTTRFKELEAHAIAIEEIFLGKVQ